MRAGLSLATLFALLCITASAAPAAEVSLTTSGDGRFSVNGAAMDGVAGIKLSIDYDSSLLSAPAVTQGNLISGAVMVPNTTNPGTISVAIIRTTPFSGSGQIIALQFIGSSGPGGVKSINAEMIDLKGNPLPVRASISAAAQPATAGTFAAPGGAFNQQGPAATQRPQPAATAATVSATTATAAAAPSIGTLTLPDEGRPVETPKTEEPPLKEPPPQEPYQPPPATTAKAEESGSGETKAKQAKKSDELKKVSYPSVLERFRTFEGERKIAALAELFTRPVAAEAEQLPPIAVSDGKQTVRLLAGFATQGDESAPNFAATEARVQSLKLEENSGRWIIDLVPARDTMTASVSILLGSRLHEVPAVTLPPAGSLKFSEKEVAAFLQDYAVAKPLFDLNSDGRHDYMDDYIYTGHYLLNRTSSREQKPKQ